MKQNANHLSVTASLMLLLVTIIWGYGFIFVNIAVKAGLAPSLLLALRFFIPAAIMAVLFQKELVIAGKKDLLYSAGAGVILFLAFACQTYGVKYTTPANSAFLTATNVIMVPFLSFLLFGQRPGRRSVICAFCCFAGAVILSWSPGIGIDFNIGDMLTLLCAFLFACHYAYLGFFAPKIESSGVLSCVQLFTTAVLAFILFIVKELPLFSLETLSNCTVAILYLALFSTGFCYFVQCWAQKRVSPSSTAIILSAEGFFGSLFSVLLGYDEPTVTFVTGGAIIIASVVLVQVDFNELKAALQKKRTATKS